MTNPTPKALTADDIRNLAFRSQIFGDGKDGYFFQQYVAKEYPEIAVVVTGTMGKNNTRRVFIVGGQEFPDGEFQAVADAYNALQESGNA